MNTRTISSRTARYTVPHGEVLRAEIVRLAAEGKANGEIARRLDSSLRMVSLWRRCLSEERLAARRSASPSSPRRS